MIRLVCSQLTLANSIIILKEKDPFHESEPPFVDRAVYSPEKNYAIFLSRTAFCRGTERAIR